MAKSRKVLSLGAIKSMVPGTVAPVENRPVHESSVTVLASKAMSAHRNHVNVRFSLKRKLKTTKHYHPSDVLEYC